MSSHYYPTAPRLRPKVFDGIIDGRLRKHPSKGAAERRIRSPYGTPITRHNLHLLAPSPHKFPLESAP